MTTLLPIKRPLVSIETARAVLDGTEDDCLALIQSGKIRFAFNIAAPGAGRAVVRVLALSLTDLVNGTSSQPSSLADAIRYILPGSAIDIRASLVARFLNVSGCHVANLLKAGCIKLSKRRLWPTDSDRIERASIVRWLMERRLP